MNKQISTPLGIAIIVSISIFFVLLLRFDKGILPNVGIEKKIDQKKESEEKVNQFTGLVGDTVGKFKSAEEFQSYIESNKRNESFFVRGIGGAAIAESQIAPTNQSMDLSQSKLSNSVPSSEPPRFSKTNTQVLSIDEPDIVKNNGREIYFSEPEYFFARPFYDRVMPMENRKIGVSPSIYPPISPEEKRGKIKIIKALPAEEASVLNSINKSGEILLFGKSIIVLSENKSKVYSFDVSDPKNPTEKWSAEIQEGSNLISARLYRDKIYLATQRSVDYYKAPCPIYPLEIIRSDSKDKNMAKIECTDIYHPVNPVPAESTYTVLALDAENGDVKNKTSFVGPWSEETFYMSENAIYLSYSYSGDFVGLISGFLKENEDLFPIEISEKISRIGSYDISESSKNNEVQTILSRFLNSGDRDEMLKQRNEIENRITKYAKNHNRESQFTGILKIDIDKMEVVASGKIPGKPLNQFSFDEYQTNLRVATTIGGGSWFFPFGVGVGSDENVSDVYVLDKNLKTVGAVKDLGKGERIYSTRFLGDKGYVVTFKQVDPFFVLDLKNPEKPLLKGELKIPGYSSYLHPISQNVILGIGEENNKVKLSLFDVENPENPKELNTYKLDEFYSEVSNNHHAFLLDQRHGVFFLPGSQGGYVFSYEKNELKLVKSISDFEVKRALYIGDNLYILSNTKMVVLNENNWEKIKEIDF